MTRRLARLVAATLAPFALGACVYVPAGPSFLVLPGSGSSFEQFQIDDDVCHGFAMQRSGASSADAAVQAGVGEAAVATAVGAAAGAAIGAAAGDPAGGAAVGAGTGLLVGSAHGAGTAYQAGGDLQRRYDHAYVQCMYAKGHQVPVPNGLARSQGGWSDTGPAPGPELPRQGGPPLPPPGAPPPPPPDAG